MRRERSATSCSETLRWEILASWADIYTFKWCYWKYSTFKTTKNLFLYLQKVQTQFQEYLFKFLFPGRLGFVLFLKSIISINNSAWSLSTTSKVTLPVKIFVAKDLFVYLLCQIVINCMDLFSFKKYIFSINHFFYFFDFLTFIFSFLI